MATPHESDLDTDPESEPDAEDTNDDGFNQYVDDESDDGPVESAPDGEDDEPESDGEDDEVEADLADGDDDNSDGDVTSADDSPFSSNRSVRWVPLGELVLEYRHWTNPRKFTGLDEPRLRALAADILTKTTSNENGLYAGIDDALKVVQIMNNGQIDQLVLDGQRRYKAVILAFGQSGRTPDTVLVPVTDREPEPVQDWTEQLARKYYREAVTVASLREGLSTFELSESAELLRGTRDMDSGKELTIADVARSLGRSESWVSKILIARKNASPKLLHKWRNGDLTEEQFRDLAASAAGDEDEQERQAQKVKDEAASGNKGGARRAAKEAAELKRQEARGARAAKKAAEETAKEARRAAKEAKKAAKSTKAAKGTQGSKGHVVDGQQADLPFSGGKDKEAPKDAPRAPAKPKAPSPVVIDDLLDQVKRHPPTNDLVKGIVFGIQVATGRLEFDALPKAWVTYITHLHGKPDKRK